LVRFFAQIAISYIEAHSAFNPQPKAQAALQAENPSTRIITTKVALKFNHLLTEQ